MIARTSNHLDAGRLAGMRVLVVEDEYYIADDLRRSLKGAGACIIGPVGSVSQAEAALEKGDFDCGVLDLNLHGVSADIVADQLKIMEIPFAIATGYGSSAVPERHNDVPRLEKPFDPSQVVELVSRWERLRAD
jgi:DNA-binding NtrC family response regulator